MNLNFTWLDVAGLLQAFAVMLFVAIVCTYRVGRYILLYVALLSAITYQLVAIFSGSPDLFSFLDNGVAYAASNPLHLLLTVASVVLAIVIALAFRSHDVRHQANRS